MMKRRHFLLALVAVFAARSPGRAQLGQRSKPPAMPWMEWLNAPPRQDIAWQVRALPATLSWSQRQLVIFKVLVDPAPLQQRGPHRDLHLYLRAQDSDHRWLPDESYTHL